MSELCNPGTDSGLNHIQFSLAATSASSALEVFYEMRYINLRFTLLYFYFIKNFG